MLLITYGNTGHHNEFNITPNVKTKFNGFHKCDHKLQRRGNCSLVLPGKVIIFYEERMFIASIRVEDMISALK